MKNMPSRELQGWTKRVLAVNALDAENVDAAWLGLHMERFVGFSRLNCESFDFPTAVAAYSAYIRGESPPPSGQLLQEIRQALILLKRGIERWRWDHDPKIGKPALKFRVKVAGVNEGMAPAVSRVAATAPHSMSADWIEALRRSLRLNHYSLRTEQSYIEMLRRYLAFIGSVPPEADNVRAFLEHLAVERRVAASTQNQALSALLYFFRRVLNREMGELGETLRAARGRHLPVVLGQDEVKRLMLGVDGTAGLMLRLLYGTGMRLMECLRLRVKAAYRASPTRSLSLAHAA
ncbi:MAG: phage integrase N-terminal SAM-like domain-containing protein [Verrucomicrobiota bacterium]